jgi:hypothetical protein
VAASFNLLIRCFIATLTLSAPCGTLFAAPTIDLGTAADFGALAGSSISGTGNVTGDLGTGTGTIAPAITSSGTVYFPGQAAVMTALTDFSTAYADGQSRTPDVILSAAAFELGGATLTPGVYSIGAAATLSTPVTINGQGDPDAVFIIQVGASLTSTASTGNVILTNDAEARNVFWIVNSAVSMGASVTMQGNILGNTTITLGATSIVNGRLMAGSGAGTIAMATQVNVPIDPSTVGDLVWFDASIDGIQDPSETTGFSGLPVSLLQMVLEKTTIELGTAADFGLLAGGAISGTGNVSGHLGTGTGTIAAAITSSGTVYFPGQAAVLTAITDFDTAYADGKNRTPDVILSAAAYGLGGVTLTPGVYSIGAAATLATPMTIDAQNDPEAVFIIQIVGDFSTTASSGNVVLANQAGSANVFWIVDGAVSLGAGSSMQGTILSGSTVTFGATTTISGRALAGSATGTIALSTTVSAVTGTPPVGFPPPVAVASTVTDASGNYLFEGVQPGTFMVSWDLTSITTDYNVTVADQGGNDALDSDSASGNVGGLVYSTEFVVLGGSTNIDMDLGLAETLPAIKAIAKDDLTTQLVTYLLAEYYTSEDWAAIQSAKANGDIAIDASTTPLGVAEAKAAALVAMYDIPTVAQTLAAAKVSALLDMTTTLNSYAQVHYTSGNWSTITSAKTNGDAAINTAADLVALASTKSSSLRVMDAVGGDIIISTFDAQFARLINYVAAGITYNAQFSNDRVSWEDSPATPTFVGAAPSSGYELVEVPFIVLTTGVAAGEDGRFFRAVDDGP